MSEIKPCPFCGEPADDRYQRLAKCRNDKCLMNDWVEDDTLFHLDESWNTRPIEDALIARITALEAENAALRACRDGYDPKESKPEDGVNVIVECSAGTLLGWYCKATDKWFDSFAYRMEIRNPLRWWRLPNLPEAE